jgi:Protein of unknown function (DUF3667)
LSHFKERTAKNCLNCNAIVDGKYCQVCGQENIEPKESFWHLVSHFFNDITHFDGKFFTTTKLLLLKPGLLPKEYLLGKRASYLHPIRMYVFTSFVFFLLFFTFSGDGLNIGINSPEDEKRIANQKKMDLIDSIQLDVKDTTILEAMKIQKQVYQKENEKLDSIDLLKLNEIKIKKKKNNADTFQQTTQVIISDSLFQSLKDSAKNPESAVKMSFADYPDSVTSIEQYEKYQAKLPEKQRDGWIESKFIKRQILIDKKYRYEEGAFLKVLMDKFLHSLPQMFFITLPIFAFILQLLYIRRKEFYYTDHGIFSIYHFIAVFIIWIFILLIGKLQSALHWEFLRYVILALTVGILFYLYKSMRNFYQQSRAKTILKFILLCIISGTITAILTVGLLLLTFLKG